MFVILAVFFNGLFFENWIGQTYCILSCFGLRSFFAKILVTLEMFFSKERILGMNRELLVPRSESIGLTQWLYVRTHRREVVIDLLLCKEIVCPFCYIALQRYQQGPRATHPMIEGKIGPWRYVWLKTDKNLGSAFH